MVAYVIVQTQVTNPEKFEEYRLQAQSTVEAFGGTYIVRGGAMEVLEGECPYPRCVVIKFSSMDQAKAWHASVEYEGPKALRQSASRGYMVVVEGL